MSKIQNQINNNYQTLEYTKLFYELKFEPIKSYLESTKEMIIAQEYDMMKKVVKWSEEQKNNPEKSDAFDIYKTEILNSGAFPKILHKSIYLTIYSMFESEFYALCEQCRQISNLNLGSKDLNDKNYISQCRKYVTKVLEVKLDRLNTDWTKIGKYQLIRNAIAHNNGVLKDLKKDNLKFINDTFGISVDSISGEIQIDSIDFLKRMVDILVNFLKQIIVEIINQKEKPAHNKELS